LWQVAYPNGGEVLSTRYVDINWTGYDIDSNNISIDVYYDVDNDKNNGRFPIALNQSNTGHYRWDLLHVTNGWYHISIDIWSYDLAANRLLLETDYSDAPFFKTNLLLSYKSHTYNATVARNAAPYAEVVYPNGNEALNGNVTIRFIATDPDTLHADLYYSAAQGARENKIVSGYDLSEWSSCARSQNIVSSPKVFDSQEEWKTGSTQNMDIITSPGDMKITAMDIVNVTNVALASNGGVVSAQRAPWDVNDVLSSKVVGMGPGIWRL